MAEALKYANRASLLGWTALVAATALSTAFAWSAVFGDIGVASQKHERFEALPNTPSLSAEDALPEILAIFEKPLFLRGRSPFKPAPAVAPAAELQPAPEEPPAPDFLIGGIMITPVKRQALLRTSAEEVGLWLAEGEFTSDGWTLASVAPTHVLFQRSGRQFVRELYNPLP